MPDILHLSDLHFGPPFLRDRAEAAHALAGELRPDLLVVSGDFTQRARARQFERARAYLDRFDIPRVVTSGNHDVPLYRLHERLFAPHRLYRRHIHPELDYVVRIDGLTVVSLNSSRRFTLSNGKLFRRQLDLAAEAFAASPPGDVRAIVTHHHLAPPPDFERDVMPGAKRALAEFTRMDVHLILAGHKHRSYIGDSLDFFPEEQRERGVIVVHCGTTTSARGRGRERLRNSLNLISAGDRETVVTHYLWRDAEGSFRPHSQHRFGSRRRPWLGPDPEDA